MAAHLTLLPFLGRTLETGTGKSRILDAAPIELSAQEVGGSVSHAGYRLRLPASASLRWPVLPHNPYRRDGRSTVTEGRNEIRIPFTETEKRHDLLLEALDPTEGDS